MFFKPLTDIAMDALLGAFTLSGGTPAPYGKACTNCVKAKCRCIYRVGGPDCERWAITRGLLCNRLAKQCVPSVSVRKRTGKRAHVSRAAQLEEKIEDLVTLLRNQPTPSSALPQPVPPSAPDRAVSSTAAPLPNPGPTLSIAPGLGTPAPSHHSSNAGDEEDIFVPARTRCQPQKPQKVVVPGTLLAHVFEPSHPNPVSDQLSHEDLPACEYQPGAAEAEENLTTFRRNMLVFLPFVYIPPDMTSDKLRSAYPFLWYNIMTITCRQVDRQLLMSDAIKKFVAQKMVIENQKSMDLLWGLMAYMSWTQYYRKDKPYFSLLASLAKSLVFDFCLNKPPKPPHAAICLRDKLGPLPPKQKTTEERRAVLACFFITSQISTLMKRIDALAWTPFMDECLSVLSKQPEWSGDEVLVALVKIQRLLEQLTQAIWQSSDQKPPAFFVSALKTQLYDLKAQLGPHVQQNAGIMALLYTAELMIVESAMQKPTNDTTTSSYVPDLQRFEAFEATLQVTKKWFDNHLAIPSCMHVGLTFMHWCTMGHCIWSLTHLSFEIEDPTWDRRAVKERVDIFGIADRVIQAFDDVAGMKRQESGPSMAEDVFTKCAKLVRLIKHNWVADTMAMDQRLPTQQGMTVAPADIVGGAQTPGPLSMPLFQLQDTAAWMADFFEMEWDP
ncbi:hypothetical protein QBC47DRAFT_346879 [Echria macrotheca]|uniref:Zn(2)-C6 fungal-type domain-containing protein n=1 Tax=Echria macrotheca TaxID=438768 RepID=A0AAJ0BE54_9PEZI|nr:hypothetical protein QBC47DRAFT_346879 [Echria macrotheca]